MNPPEHGSQRPRSQFAPARGIAGRVRGRGTFKRLDANTGRVRCIDDDFVTELRVHCHSLPLLLRRGIAHLARELACAFDIRLVRPTLVEATDDP